MRFCLVWLSTQLGLTSIIFRQTVLCNWFKISLYVAWDDTVYLLEIPCISFRNTLYVNWHEPELLSETPCIYSRSFLYMLAKRIVC